MDGTRTELTPRARQRALVVRELDGELLIFDRERDIAHALNGTAAAVWKRCDGATSVTEMAQLLSAELGQRVDESMIFQALKELDRQRLLDEYAGKAQPPGTLSRRDMVVKTGLAAAAVIPVITSLAAPSGTALAQTACTQQGQPCDPLTGAGSNGPCCGTNPTGGHPQPGCCYVGDGKECGGVQHVCGICSGNLCQPSSCMQSTQFCPNSR